MGMQWCRDTHERCMLKDRNTQYKHCFCSWLHPFNSPCMIMPMRVTVTVYAVNQCRLFLTVWSVVTASFIRIHILNISVISNSRLKVTSASVYICLFSSHYHTFWCMCLWRGCPMKEKAIAWITECETDLSKLWYMRGEIWFKETPWRVVSLSHLLFDGLWTLATISKSLHYAWRQIFISEVKSK